VIALIYVCNNEGSLILKHYVFLSEKMWHVLA